MAKHEIRDRGKFEIHSTRNGKMSKFLIFSIFSESLKKDFRHIAKLYFGISLIPCDEAGSPCIEDYNIIQENP